MLPFVASTGWGGLLHPASICSHVVLRRVYLVDDHQRAVEDSANEIIPYLAWANGTISTHKRRIAMLKLS